MSLIQSNTNSDAEGTMVGDNGFKSSPNIDYTLLDWEVISTMAVELQRKCDEYGGAYPRNNWRLGSTASHLNSLTQHIAAYHLGIGDSEEHLLHTAIRAMFALATFNQGT